MIENSNISQFMSKRSTKALQKPLIQKERPTQNLIRHLNIIKQRKQNQKLRNSNQKLRKSNQFLRKSNQKLKFTQTINSPRSIHSFLNQEQKNTNNFSNKNLFKHKKYPSTFAQTFQSIYNSNPEQSLINNQSKWNEDKMKFNSTLRKFTKLIQSQTSQNHSPRKQTINGSQQPFDSSKLMSITMRNFRTLQPQLTPKQKDVIRDRTTKNDISRSFHLNLPQIYRVKQQSKNQKQKFYKSKIFINQFSASILFGKIGQQKFIEKVGQEKKSNWTGTVVYQIEKQINEKNISKKKQYQ